ncbi:hypothetical protein [Mucilaginibacter pocheonensis]|uniref:Chemotaxis protein histidine kinase CheA n=1 Tax=Mucilaginibacter pocheonensis TaxID=398050 RepID=A0ABU1TIQ5_9SPHI|nr:hypothetical protein [Mucilaginibacter pocheonensis]MDR6945146.1 chemotaxis protein histidine kinase CheA [Mucilaginibacter pocheonensis]
MKQMDVFKKIGGILKELNDQYDYLEAESSELNELELELFVANAHFLKDHAEILRRLHERSALPLQLPPAETPHTPAEKSEPSPAEKRQDPIHEQRYFEPVVQQKAAAETKLELTPEVEPPVQAPYNPAKVEPIIPQAEEQQPVPLIDLGADSSGDTYSFERQEPEPVKQELEINEAAEWEDEGDQFEQEELTEQLPAQVAETAPSVEPLPPQAPAEQIAADANDTKASDENKVLTINQKISALKAEKEKAATSPANVLPVTDLKSAINLNDKLLYIKDLFNGYSLAYSEAIEILNRFNSFDEAERFLKSNYVVKNNWESKQATVEKFFALLKRRYPTG